MSGESESTAVATTGGDVMAAIKERGATEVAMRREANKLAKQIAGTSWGNSMSPLMRGVAGEYCAIVGANPHTHLDVLGGKFYLNGEFFADKVAAEELHVDYVQIDVSPAVEQGLREKAARIREQAEGLAEPHRSERMLKAMEAEDEAEDIATERSRWSPRPTATSVVVTKIRRFINAAPLDLIREGKVTDLTPYIVEVEECNWAGGYGEVAVQKKNGGTYNTYDPIGDANPGTTARTRSFRRCANKAYATWKGENDAKIEKAEQYLEASWELVESEPHDPGSQPEVTLGGEGEIVQDAEIVQATEVKEEPVDDFDRADARKRLFATLKSAGIKDSKRKAWCAEHGLPASTKEWSFADFERVQEILVHPVRDEVVERAGDSLEDLALSVIKDREPKYLKHWNALKAALDAAVDEGDDAEGDFGGDEL